VSKASFAKHNASYHSSSISPLAALEIIHAHIWSQHNFKHNLLPPTRFGRVVAATDTHQEQFASHSEESQHMQECMQRHRKGRFSFPWQLNRRKSCCLAGTWNCPPLFRLCFRVRRGRAKAVEKERTFRSFCASRSSFLLFASLSSWEISPSSSSAASWEGLQHFKWLQVCQVRTLSPPLWTHCQVNVLDGILEF